MANLFQVCRLIGWHHSLQGLPIRRVFPLQFSPYGNEPLWAHSERMCPPTQKFFASISHIWQRCSCLKDQNVLQGLWKCLVEESGASTEERLVLHRLKRVTKRHWKHCSWELFLEWNHCHLGKRGNFLVTCLLSSAFIYNIVYSSYFCFGVTRWRRLKHTFSVLFKIKH